MRKILGAVATLLILITHQNAYSHSGAHSRLDIISHQLEERPNSPELLIERSKVYLEQNRSELALADLNTAEKLAPSSPQLLLGYAHYYETQQQPAKAIEYYTQHIDQQGFHLENLYQRAQNYKALKNTTAAIKDYETIIHTVTERSQANNKQIQNSLRPDIYFELSDLYKNNGQIDKALQALDSGIEVFGLLSHFQREAIQLELKQNRPEAALKRNESLRVMLGKTPEWQYQQALLMNSAGKKTEALAQLEKVKITVTEQLKKQKREQLINLLNDINTTTDQIIKTQTF